ncbi:putative UDP-glucuronosyl/UDP-glucosyltransferase, UDP-glycosyltransferase family [Helianthus annuus]|nr:putative UDP-glucuronosyl/UDP-glucosyltransferase, UDP-glycosyltransferase family [Helianthus annuus]
MDAKPIVGRKKPHVVFIPYPAQSHIKCMLKLARLLHHKGTEITFINTEWNHKRLFKYGGSSGLDGIPDFRFKTVPDGLPSSSDDGTEPTQTVEELGLYLLTNFLDPFLDLVAGLETPPTCIICDGTMTFTNIIDATEKLKIPIFLYWTMAASGFMAFYLAKVLLEKGILPLKDESYLTNGYTDTLLEVPGMQKVRLRDLPEHLLATKLDDPSFNWYVDSARRADKVPHVIIHTFDELEAPLIKEIKSRFPHTYTVGPLQLLVNQITENETKKTNFNGYSLWKEEPECVQWLHSKEPNSVVYVNFGSITVMSLENLVEFGWGLVNSNHNFLWIIRTDLVDGKPVTLPQELEEEIKRKGFIASWCSQEEVLNHPSVGGFLTHGGWGSVIESLTAGVPMVCWPFSYDQNVNCRQLCKEWEVGMMIEGDVKRDEVEKIVRELMEGVEGNRMRKNAMEFKKKAEITTAPNGSSSLNIEELVNEITNLS